MRKSWLVCVLLGTLAWGQSAPSAPPAPQAGVPGNMAMPQALPDTSAAVPPDAAVITINGICSPKPQPAAPKAATGTAAKTTAAAKAPAAAPSPADCKTIITKEGFEKLASGVAPNMTPQLKKQLGGALPRFIAMSNAAEKKGLDKTPRFAEMMKFARMQILTNELQRNIQEEAAKVPPEDVATYYKEHAEAFQQFNLDRLFVPRSKSDLSEAKEADDEKNEKLSEEAQKAKEAEEKAKADENEQAMTKLADSLRARAVAGENFMTLQKEAFAAAGMKIESPTVNLPNVRSNALPPAHASAFELKPGEVGQVLNDSGGHYIYKMNSKEQLPLDKVESEIHSTLQNQRTREMMDAVNGSFKVETNEMYFGPGGAGAPPPRMPNPRMAPGPIPPQAKPQTPPATQPPTKPN